MILSVLWMAACAAVPSVESVLERMAALSIPDTADYRTTTTVRGEGISTVVLSHVIQAGPASRWIEMEAAGRRTRMVVSNGRASMTDLVSKKTIALPSVPNVEDPVAAMRRFLASKWSAPVSRGGALWEMAQDVSGDASVVSRSIVWDDAAGDVRSLAQIGRSGDTTRLEFEWIRTGGHVVPSAIRIAQGVGNVTIRTEMTFSDWKFPRSLPSNLFSNP